MIWRFLRSQSQKSPRTVALRFSRADYFILCIYDLMILYLHEQAEH